MQYIRSQTTRTLLFVRAHARVVGFGMFTVGAVLYALSSATLFFPQVFNVFGPTLYEAPHATNTATVVGRIMGQSQPTRLRVPSIDVEADFASPLGIRDDKEVEVPKEYDKVGWYKYGPTPGSLGPSVIFGHVDSKAGPAVFYSLGQVSVGDSIFVDREDGSTAEFEVTLLERYPQKDFPTEKVYGNLNYAGIRLITCTGIYDSGDLRYTHNLVVYGKLKAVPNAVSEIYMR